MSQPTDPPSSEPTDEASRHRESNPRRRLTNRLRVLAPSGRTSRALLIFPLLAAAFYLAVSLYLKKDAPGGYEIFSFAVDLYNLLPALALASLISLSSHHMAKGIPVVAAGSLVFTAVAIYVPLSILTSDSSTAVLGFLFLPLLLGTMVIIVGLLALFLHALRSRHEDRSVPPPL